MPTLTLGTTALDGDGHGRCLAVLLPGRLDKPGAFEHAGFHDAVAELGLPLDLVAVDAHLGYYRKRSVIDRLREDVLDPARSRGYERIYLVGTSLGGLGSLLYLRDHPEQLEAIVALAPFLGKNDVIDEIEAAGGPGSWQVPDPLPDGLGHELWSWLAPWLAGDQEPKLYLGWGTADDFDRANRLLAGALPEERVFTDPGGHDWATWARLWRAFLARARPCAPPP